MFLCPSANAEGGVAFKQHGGRGGVGRGGRREGGLCRLDHTIAFMSRRVRNAVSALG